MKRAGSVSSPEARSRRWRALLAALAISLGAGSAAAATIELDAAEFVLDDAPSPPPESASWRPQPLPDNWNLSRPGQDGYGWYRLRFRLPSAADSPYAVYVRKLSMNAAFHVNGVYLGSGGTFDEPVARQWNRPQFFVVPPQLLRAGENDLYVRLRAYSNSRGGLGTVEVGPETELRPLYERRYFVQTVLPQLCNIVVAALGAFAFALWVKRRAEPTYVWFCVFSLLWAFRSTHMFVRDIPVGAFWWDIWVQSSFGWCALLFIVLAMRFSGRRWPRFEAALAGYAALGPVAMYLGGPERLHAIASNWSFVIVPVAMFFEGFLIREAWRQRTATSILLAAVWALIIAASVHDGLVHRDRLAFDSFYYVSYVMILLSLVMGWMLTKRFVAALNAAEELNVVLEDRVAQKHAELERHFRRLQEMERASAIAEERSRMMSEMHDCIGAQLIATLELTERGQAPRPEIARGLREVLDGLRLTIDSLEPTDDDLAGVLGNLRYRLEGRLRRQGIALDWRVTDLPKLHALTPHKVLHVLRILQEALTNVTKHAHARKVTVSTACTDRHVVISVADDGRGLAPGHREGRGIASMRKRARALEANLVVAPALPGTRLTLELPRAA